MLRILQKHYYLFSIIFLIFFSSTSHTTQVPRKPTLYEKIKNIRYLKNSPHGSHSYPLYSNKLKKEDDLPLKSEHFHIICFDFNAHNQIDPVSRSIVQFTSHTKPLAWHEQYVDWYEHNHTLLQSIGNKMGAAGIGTAFLWIGYHFMRRARFLPHTITRYTPYIDTLSKTAFSITALLFGAARYSGTLLSYLSNTVLAEAVLSKEEREHFAHIAPGTRLTYKITQLSPTIDLLSLKEIGYNFYASPLHMLIKQHTTLHNSDASALHSQDAFNFDDCTTAHHIICDTNLYESLPYVFRFAKRQNTAYITQASSILRNFLINKISTCTYTDGRNYQSVISQLLNPDSTDTGTVVLFSLTSH